MEIDRIPLLQGELLVGELTTVGPESASELSAWREANSSGFLTVFRPDIEGTREWIHSVRSSEDRLLLAVDTVESGMVGHAGLTNIDRDEGKAEIDNILRGRPAPPGTMRLAVETLMGWAAAQGLGKIGVRVLSDNPAVRFYEKLGFIEESRQPLQRVETPEGHTWVPSEGAEAVRYLVSMSLPDSRLSQIREKRGFGTVR